MITITNIVNKRIMSKISTTLLTRFIHPHCDYCKADFEDRTDWHYHK